MDAGRCTRSTVSRREDKIVGLCRCAEKPPRRAGGQPGGLQRGVDGRRGQGSDGVVREFIDLRTRHHTELHEMLRDSGQTPDDSGSFMSTVHRTVIKVRSLFSGLDESVLPGLIDGEKRIVEYYEDVEKSSPIEGPEIM